MASKRTEMYAKKQCELGEIKNGIIAYFDQLESDVVRFKESILRELGESNTLLPVFEKRYPARNRYVVGLLILLCEFQGYQSADIIATGGMGFFPQKR